MNIQNERRAFFRFSPRHPFVDCEGPDYSAKYHPQTATYAKWRAPEARHRVITVLEWLVV
eukprot:1377293-Amorphochlora_amoeboformis.AAC.1